MAGTVDFVTVEPFPSTALCEKLAEMAAEEALEQAGIGSKGDFPGPLFLAVPCRDRVAAATGGWTRRRQDGIRLQRPAARQRRERSGLSPALRVRFGCGIWQNIRHQGFADLASTACASGATAIQLGVEAIRRGETDAALCVATDGSVNPETWSVFRCCRRCRPKTIRLRRRPSRSRRTATVSSWLKAPAHWCWKAMRPRSRAAQRSSVSLPAAANWPILPPHPFKPRRQADNRLHAQGNGEPA